MREVCQSQLRKSKESARLKIRVSVGQSRQQPVHLRYSIRALGQYLTAKIVAAQVHSIA
jgi:ABC-type transporter MlaC component